MSTPARRTVEVVLARASAINDLDLVPDLIIRTADASGVSAIDPSAADRRAVGNFGPIERAELDSFYTRDAEALVRALAECLPGATLDRVTIALLKHQASVLRVPHERPVVDRLCDAFDKAFDGIHEAQLRESPPRVHDAIVAMEHAVVIARGGR